MSADWSCDCVPLLTSLSDPRNLLSAVLYGWMAWCVAAARPVALAANVLRSVRDACGSSGGGGGGGRGSSGVGAVPPTAGGEGVLVARWRLFVLVGLILGPFFPASNVLFFVGTFIGERLMYSPSIGYCMLVAHLLTSYLLPKSFPPAEASPKSPPRPPHGQPASRSSTAKLTWSRALVPLLLASAPLVALYTARTVVRNWDWYDEERLFLSAYEVCPDSAKVQQNVGILRRRQEDYGAALANFRWGGSAGRFLGSAGRLVSVVAVGWALLACWSISCAASRLSGCACCSVAHLTGRSQKTTRRAKELVPNYCEPDYWIGISLLNQVRRRHQFALFAL
jgi:hypothetical protein